MNMSAATLLLLFAQATQDFGLPPDLLSSLCFVESHYDVKAINLDDGSSSSIGVCQIKLSTSRYLGFRGSERQLQNPSINIYYSGKYLRHQLDRYHWDIHKAVAAYNSGTVKFKNSEQFANQSYVNKVFKKWRVSHEVPKSQRLSKNNRH